MDIQVGRFERPNNIPHTNVSWKPTHESHRIIMTPILIQEVLLIRITGKKKPDKNQAKKWEHTLKLYIERGSNNISSICCKLFFNKC